MIICAVVVIHLLCMTVLRPGLLVAIVAACGRRILSPSFLRPRLRFALLLYMEIRGKLPYAHDGFLWISGSLREVDPMVVVDLAGGFSSV